MLFRRKKNEPAVAEAAVDESPPSDGEEPESPGNEGEPELGAEEDVARAWRDRAEHVIPGGASTGSKRAEAVYGGGQTDAPLHYTRAAGCEITLVDGRTVTDCTMSLGAVAIGYGDQLVATSVAEAAAAGHVAGLSHVLEVRLAERLCEVIPCAEAVRFLKTGAEAVAAAVRIARTYTGRDRIIASGYFGWLDWASEAAGVPEGARRDVTRVPFDDVAALARAAREAGNQLAAVVLEPVIDRFPSEEWVRAARTACDRVGAVLIFDEIKTGFRLRPGGYQELSGIEPDVATFGKALANGFPLSAVVGRADVMDAARRTWISSTLAGEATALAAAGAVLEWHQRAAVDESLAEIGAEMRAGVARAVEASGIAGVRLDGIDQMWLLRFDDPSLEQRFFELALTEGVLFKRGAYNYAALAHDDDALGRIEHAASTAFVNLRQELEE